MVLGAPDRVNIPCLMHDTRLCQLDVKMTNNYHGTKSIKIENLSRCKNVSSIAAVNIGVAVAPYLRPRCTCVFYHMMEYGPIECKG